MMPDKMDREKALKLLRRRYSLDAATLQIISDQASEIELLRNLASRLMGATGAPRVNRRDGAIVSYDHPDTRVAYAFKETFRFSTFREKVVGELMDVHAAHKSKEL